MAKGDRWSDDQDVQVREMRNAETILGVIRHRPLESCLRSKDSRAVRRGAVRKVPQGNSLAAYSTPVRFDERGVETGHGGAIEAPADERAGNG